jgi:hypothetical protein
VSVVARDEGLTYRAARGSHGRCNFLEGMINGAREK